MCSRVTCPTCNKPTWSGCGQHVEQALAGVAEKDRCHCDASGAAPAKAKGFFARLRG